MMGTSKWACSHQRCILTESSRHGMNLGRFQRFMKGERWKNGGEPLCQHSLSCSGRTNHNYIVSTGCGNFHGTFDVFLTLNIFKVRVIKIELGCKNLLCIHL